MAKQLMLAKVKNTMQHVGAAVNVAIKGLGEWDKYNANGVCKNLAEF